MEYETRDIQREFNEVIITTTTIIIFKYLYLY